MEYLSETADALGFAPIGLDEPYRVFMTKDPLGEYGDVNLYRMVANSPVNFVDPYGLHRIRGPYGEYYHSGCADRHYHPNGDAIERPCSEMDDKLPPPWMHKACKKLESKMCEASCATLGPIGKIASPWVCPAYTLYMCGPDYY